MSTEGSGATPEGDNSKTDEGSATPPTPPPATGDTLGDGGKAALQAEREARKAAEKTARESQQTIDRMKTALGDKQTAESTAAEAKAEAEAAKQETMRLRVAMETGLPADAVPRLVGTTEGELREDAERLKAMLGKPKRAPKDASAGNDGQGTKPSGSMLLKASLGR